jgi:hypothetical protein
MLHTIGLLAGVVGTADEQEALRQQVLEGIEAYLQSIEIPEEQLNPFAVPIGAPPEASSGMAIAYLFYRLIGYDEGVEMITRAGEANDRANRAVVQMVSDFIQSLWNSLRDWLNDFWATYESEGLIIALNRARIDVAFFAAECAIDVGISVVTAGMGAAAVAALKGIRIVGMRVARNVTKVVIKAVPDMPNRAPTYLTDIDLPDDAIDPQFDRIVDEDRFGGASTIDDTDTRISANPDTPNTTVIRGAGRNEATITVDPETGRPESVQATISSDMGANPRGDNATAIGALGRDGDHGGHLIAHRFMGDVPDEGIVPQAGNLNTGAWKKMENEWADWIAYGRTNRKQIEIEINIDVDPPGAVRPDHFYGDYTVYEIGQDGSRTVLRTSPIDMANEPGQTFERVYFRTDPDGTIQLR